MEDCLLPKETGNGRRVLVADDDGLSQLIAVRMLERQGYAVLVVGSGREALAALERDKFDIVLMDIQMPDMDGYEVTREIRDGERLTGEHIPIVAMTAQALTGAKQSCLAAGMDGYVSKPIRMAELFGTIESARRQQIICQVDSEEDAHIFSGSL